MSFLRSVHNSNSSVLKDFIYTFDKGINCITTTSNVDIRGLAESLYISTVKPGDNSRIMFTDQNNNSDFKHVVADNVDSRLPEIDIINADPVMMSIDDIITSSLFMLTYKPAPFFEDFTGIKYVNSVSFNLKVNSANEKELLELVDNIAKTFNVSVNKILIDKTSYNIVYIKKVGLIGKPASRSDIFDIKSKILLLAYMEDISEVKISHTLKSGKLRYHVSPLIAELFTLVTTLSVDRHVPLTLFYVLPEYAKTTHHNLNMYKFINSVCRNENAQILIFTHNKFIINSCKHHNSLNVRLSSVEVENLNKG